MRGFGKIEHCVVSVSPSDYGLSEEVMREKCRVAALDRGIIGGCMIFHGYRPDRAKKILAWSCHYHVLGFIRGGYSCRKCERKWNCRAGCGGFDDRSWQGFQKDGYLVKVLDERKTIIGTAWYQLNHATLRVGVKRFHVINWFGLCGNSKMKVSAVKPEVPCPACNSAMERVAHVGKKHISYSMSEEEYESLFLDDEFDDVGDPNYVRFGGGRVE
jgi:hypothetical protein